MYRIDSVLALLFMLAEIDNFTAEEYKQYVKSLENMGYYQNIINTAVEEAELRGREEGKLDKAVEIAGRMLAAGMDRSDVAELVGLAEEELDAAMSASSR